MVYTAASLRETLMRGGCHRSIREVHVCRGQAYKITECEERKYIFHSTVVLALESKAVITSKYVYSAASSSLIFAMAAAGLRPLGHVRAPKSE